LAREGFQVPPDVQALLDERDAARSAKDFTKGDEIRTQLTKMGWEVMDLPDGTAVRPLMKRPEDDGG
jgi:cysteinyl-tRNA synthetase